MKSNERQTSDRIGRIAAKVQAATAVTARPLAPARVFAASLLFVACLCFFLAIAPGVAFGSFGYRIPKQQDELTVNTDGSVSLVRYFEFAVSQNSTDSGTEIWIGLPTSNTVVSSVTDDNGKTVDFETRFSAGEYTLILTGFTPIKPGTARGFTVEAEVSEFLYPDSKNEGYATMQYIPGWWSAEVKVQDIAVILPGEVEKDEIKTGSRQWDGIGQTESGAYVITWRFENLKAQEKVSVNVGIPAKYVKLPVKEEPPWTPPPERLPGMPGFGPSQGFEGAVVGFVAIVAIGIVVAAISNTAKEEYLQPEVSMEGVGVNETLSPVEVSVLLRQPPEKTMTLLLFSLIQKGIVRAHSDKPLRLSIQYERDLTEVEELFVQAINRSTGELDQSKLPAVFRYLAASVNEKLKPYCRKDTEAFYRGYIAKHWAEVKAKDTPELKLEHIDKNLLWLIQDEASLKESGELFKAGPEASAWHPGWRAWGFPYMTIYGMYWWPFAIYGSFSGISRTIIHGNEAKYREITESVFTPARPMTSGAFAGRGGGSRGGHHGGFTPPSCACACACVSCACACACAGGGGCT